MVRFEEAVINTLAEQIIVAALQARNHVGLRVMMGAAVDPSQPTDAARKAAMLALHYMVMESMGTPFDMAGRLRDIHR